MPEDYPDNIALKAGKIHLTSVAWDALCGINEILFVALG